MSRRLAVGPDGRLVTHGDRLATISRCLPETLTVTLSGFASRYPSTYRVLLSFAACQGEGAAGYATAAAPDEAPSALTDETLTDGGSGYAVLGRVAPTLNDDGNVTATVTTTEDTSGPCGWPVWRVAAVPMTDPGTPWYTDNAAFTIYPAGDVTVVTPAALRVRTVRAEATVEVDTGSASGTGAVVSVTSTLSPGIDGGRDAWETTGYSIDTAGTGYAVDDILPMSTPDGVEVFAGYLRVTSVGGSGEITGLSIDVAGLYWLDTGEADIIEVDDGGEYYTEDESEPALVATVTVTAGGSGTGASFTATVDDDTASPTFGQVVGLSMSSGGSGYTATEISVPGCGEAFDGKTIVVKRLQCQGPRDAAPFAGLDDDLADTPDWPTIDFALDPAPPENGLYPETGARLEDATNWRGACLYAHLFCTGLSENSYRGGVFVSWEGNGRAPGVFVMGGPAPFAPCGTQLRTETLVGENDPIVFTAANGEATAEVSEGGEYDPNAHYAGQWSCAQCCQGAEEIPAEITATWARDPGISPANIAAIGDVPDGDYVLTHHRGTYWAGFAGATVEAHMFPYYMEASPLTAHGTPCEDFMHRCIVNVSFQGGLFLGTSAPLPDCADATIATPVCRPVGTFPIYNSAGELLGTLAFS